ncbi:MAG TPA: acetyl-CoA carboxylase biotin carboxylase subunit [bacterium]|nr:acetyl-CoA carboxylase biotin carboxylase subunit [bacterium]
MKEKLFEKILIANRGEIALRIIRTCKDLGIKSIIVHSTADTESFPVKFADSAICIGPEKSMQSYLNIPAIISAAEVSNAEAVHPGYGFLAENSEFVEICKQCNLVFIGPDSTVMNLMGNKSNARDTVKKAGFPVIPGSDKVIETIEEAKSFAKKIGYPIIIKASAGGGGRGMRVVNNETELEVAFNSAKKEAMEAFKNDSIYIEKYFKYAHHIEVQILADKYKNVIHLGERDCSIQRRHQKLLEETPSPFLNDKVRNEICEVAVGIARAVNYENAGTIEFLVDEKKNFYFMEMNTRIQVEHPITEERTGIDIVKWQILISAGYKLPFKQQDIKFIKHSIECRINAEDPDNNFMPNTGKIINCHFPNGIGVRMDSYIYEHYDVPPYYDSLLGKLIVSGYNRREAISRLNRALDEIIITGLKTTIPFHKKIINNIDFIDGNYTTNFITKLLSKGV